MRKIRRQKTEGIVDLNQAKLEANEKIRPKVSAAQKVPSPKTTNTQKNVGDADKMPSVKKENENLKPIGNVNNFKYNRPSFINRDENGKILLTRRTLIYGAIGAGALIAGATGIKVISDNVNKNSNAVDSLSVSKSNVISSDSFTEIQESFFSVENEVTLPYGSLAWANSSNIITCLIPNDIAKPLATIDVINANSGNRVNVLDQGVGLKEGFEIYDARANEDAIIWTEVNILQGEWRIFASKFNGNYNVDPVMIDKGGSDWETPTIAITNNAVYWQVLPHADGSKNTVLSSLKKMLINSLSQNSNTTDKVFSDSDVENNPFVIATSKGRMATPVYAYENSVIITPRTNSANIYYQLTRIDENNNIIDSLALPQSMKPLEAGYGNTGFNFSYDAIYNYGEGLSNLGTYTPLSKSDNYKNQQWLNFSRNPSAPPAWCGNYFVIRSTLSVCALDLKNQTYCVLDRPNASDDYGDYLASTGNCKHIVTYANIYDQPVTGEEEKYCTLRIWS